VTILLVLKLLTSLLWVKDIAMLFWEILKTMYYNSLLSLSK